MPIVSISEAARLTGKSRQTLHRHIVTGRLSKCNSDKNEIGIDTSELLRVYGSIKDYNVTDVINKQKLHDITDNVTHNVTDKIQTKNRVEELEKELAILKVKVDEQEKRIEAKQETIDSLKTALKLLEHRQEKKEAIYSKEVQITPEPPENGSTNPIETTEPSKTGFWVGFKKLFQ
ncbi:hypothetical protein [Commensalibacter nepenthis]|uniref:Entry exclusion protein 1 n=1 Tax=Commensalibacter nepenthis TaxID=3043872 RepID=A0ABT6QAL7_9PROT|nr:hypothetical protein [Commensalibacter sp. TBRC 10068]MDI2113949.1 hypothetical protein [Commensalibacter sp. TBRC 10068]